MTGKLGPHKNNELNLLMAGTKPAALSTSGTPLYNELMKEVKKNNLVGFRTLWTNDRGDFIAFFAPPHDTSNALELLKYYNNRGPKGKMSDDDHRMIGKLLGYTDDDIETFLNKLHEHEKNIKSVTMESKSSPLYHGTDIISAMQILKDASIKPNNDIISFTRDKTLWYGNDYRGMGDVQFIFDQARLTNVYKIKPVDYYNSYNDSSTFFSKSFLRSEAEERLITQHPLPLKYCYELWICNSIYEDNIFIEDKYMEDFLMFIEEQCKKLSINIVYKNKTVNMGK